MLFKELSGGCTKVSLEDLILYLLWRIPECFCGRFERIFLEDSNRDVSCSGELIWRVPETFPGGIHRFYVENDIDILWRIPETSLEDVRDRLYKISETEGGFQRPSLNNSRHFLWKIPGIFSRLLQRSSLEDSRDPL